MKTFKLPVTWKSFGFIEVEGETLEEALAKANKCALPTDGEYIEDSFAIEQDLDYIATFNE